MAGGGFVNEGWTVYLNMRLMFEKYRGLDMGAAPAHHERGVAASFASQGAVFMSGGRAGPAAGTGAHAHAHTHTHARPAVTMGALLLAPSARAAARSTDFHAAVVGALAKTPGANNFVLVSAEELTSHIHKDIAKLRAEHPGVHFEFYDYSMFAMEKPAHAGVPAHEFCSPDDAADIAIYGAAKNNFPKILTADPQAVWLGARVGDIIKITFASDNTGLAIEYRVVVPGAFPQ